MAILTAEHDFAQEVALRDLQKHSATAMIGSEHQRLLFQRCSRVWRVDIKQGFVAHDSSDVVPCVRDDQASCILFCHKLDLQARIFAHVSVLQDLVQVQLVPSTRLSIDISLFKRKEKRASEIKSNQSTVK